MSPERVPRARVLEQNCALRTAEQRRRDKPATLLSALFSPIAGGLHDLEIVEVDYAVGFRPQPRLAGAPPQLHSALLGAYATVDALDRRGLVQPRSNPPCSFASKMVSSRL